MSKDTSLSDSGTPDHCIYSSEVLRWSPCLFYVFILHTQKWVAVVIKTFYFAHTKMGFVVKKLIILHTEKWVFVVKKTYSDCAYSVRFDVLPNGRALCL